MSQENVERIRKAFAGTTAGDFSYLPDLIDDGCEFRLPPDFPGTQATRGPGGFVSVVGQAKHTGIAIDLTLYWVYTFRDRMVVKMEAFLDRAAALEAAGVSE